MKKPATLFIVLLILIGACTLTVFAHSGRTDEDGGHYDSSTGEYHYHHGWPAHSHDGGKCPYNFEDNVDHDRNSVSSSTNQRDNSDQNEKTRLTWWQWLLAIVLNAPWVYALFSCVIIPSFRSADKEQMLHKIGSISVLILSSSAIILFFTTLTVLLYGITINRIITMSVCGGLLVFSIVMLLTVNRIR